LNFWTWLCLNGLDGCHFNPSLIFAIIFSTLKTMAKKVEFFSLEKTFINTKKASALIACLKVFQITSL
jgi:hypothetical protein